ncbi:MAG: alpha/beta hydrolase [Solirubrobacteraceae bacterium]|nr:alpha/beta hydrolase [Patulibacter sp.]
MPTLLLNEAALDYDVAGDDGPLVVQLHGLTSSRARDVQLGLDLPRALREHRVLRYDARAHGRSTGSTNPVTYTWPRLAEDLLHLLDDVAPGEQVHGVGPSMGSATLLHASLLDPERFASLTLLVPPTAWDTRVNQRATYLVNADLVEREGLEAFVELGLAAPVVPALADAPRTVPTVAEALLPSVLRGAAMSDLPPAYELASIKTPTLVLAWSDDPTHPVSTATRLAETLPNARLVVARTPYGVMAWPGLFADHVTGQETEDVEAEPATG